MKAQTYWAAAVVGLILAVRALGQDISVGDPLEKVRAILGPPSGSMACGSYALLYYERGRVELADGKVTSFDLVSAEVAETLRRERQEREEQERLARERERVRLIAEGSSVRLEKLADAGFVSSPAEERVAFWRAFRTTYPGVQLGAEYAEALEELRVQHEERRAEAEREARLASLEQRVREAEDRAAEAEARARRSRSGWYDAPWGYVGYQPVRSYAYPCAPKPRPPVCVETPRPAPFSLSVAVNTRPAAYRTRTTIPVVTTSPLIGKACWKGDRGVHPFGGPAKSWP